MKPLTHALYIVSLLLVASVAYFIGTGKQTSPKLTAEPVEEVSTRPDLKVPSLTQTTSSEGPNTVLSILDTAAFIDRNYWFRQYLLEMTPETARQVLAELEAQPPSTKRRDLMNKFFKRWVKSRPRKPWRTQKPTEARKV